MVLQTVGIVAAFFTWVRKMERDIRKETMEAIDKALKDQVKLFEKIDVLTDKMNDMRIDSMREFHSLSQGLLRLNDKVDFKKDDK